MSNEFEVSSYEDCFAHFPGVEVIEAKYYGSYQGEFLCKIKKDGETLYIHDWYGSCSGCDTFQAAFGWYEKATKEAAIEFARSYVESALPKEKIIEILSKDLSEWDHEKREMLADLAGGF